MGFEWDKKSQVDQVTGGAADHDGKRSAHFGMTPEDYDAMVSPDNQPGMEGEMGEVAASGEQEYRLRVTSSSTSTFEIHVTGTVTHGGQTHKFTASGQKGPLGLFEVGRNLVREVGLPDTDEMVEDVTATLIKKLPARIVKIHSEKRGC